MPAPTPTPNNYASSALPALPTPTPTLLSVLGATQLSDAPPAVAGYQGLAPRQLPYVEGSALAQQVLARGAMPYCVIDGLTLSAGATGLTLTVAAGHANIDGPIELPAAKTITLSNTQTFVSIWLGQDQSLSAVNGTGAPPSSNNWVLLGNATTSGGNITALDTSGVLFLKSGIVVRQTGDVAAPVDTPLATYSFFTITQFGTYFWNGFSHILLSSTTINGAEGAFITFQQSQIVIPYTALQAAALTKTFVFGVLPSRTTIPIALVEVVTAFAGTGILTLVANIGTPGNATKFQTALDLTTVAAPIQNASMPAIVPDNWATGTNLQVAVTATGANLSLLSAGSLKVTLMLLPVA